MEEQALYRAILAAPHDDAARLVYADWLDENADTFPPLVARAERARAEFIRLQCQLARLGPGGWPRYATPNRDLAKRLKRLTFQCGRKWRKAFPVTFSSAPFDRGFLRPFRVLRPQAFLNEFSVLDPPVWHPLTALSADSPLRRFVPNEPFTTCPLWDVHLYASTWQSDPLADRGQYGELLAEVGRSPALERVGWLKVSFFGTPVYDFLRTGNFPNVETLVLNAGPFPEVLNAVAANESFRSLRYVTFGENRWSWAGEHAAMVRYVFLATKLGVANDRHLPYGEMRGALRAILDGPMVFPPVPPPPPAPSQPVIAWTPAIGAGRAPPPDRSGIPLLLLGLVVAGSFFASLRDTVPARPATPAVRPFEPYRYEPPPEIKHFEELLKQRKQAIPPAQRRDGPVGPGQQPPGMVPWERPPEAPAPRPSERKDSPDEK